MIVVCIIVIVLLIIAFLPIGGTVIYGESGLNVNAVLGAVSIHVYPVKKRHKKSGKPEKSEVKKEETEASPGKLSKLKNMLPSVLKAAGRFRRSLTVNELKLRYLAANEDPYAAAMSFGTVSAGVGMILSALRSVFNIKKTDVRQNVSFTLTEPYVYLKMKVTIRIWQLIYIAVGFLTDYFSSNKNSRIERGNNNV